MSEKKQMLQFGGLWVNRSKAGEKYMVGYLGNLRLLVFKNKYKEEDKHPNYIMYLAEKEEQTDEAGEDMMDDEDEDVAF